MSLTSAVQSLAAMVTRSCPTINTVHDYIDGVSPPIVLAEVGPADPVYDTNTDTDGYEATLQIIVRIPAPDLRAAQRTGEAVLHELALMWLQPSSADLDGAQGVLYAACESTSLEIGDDEGGQANRIVQTVAVGVAAG